MDEPGPESLVIKQISRASSRSSNKLQLPFTRPIKTWLCELLRFTDRASMRMSSWWVTGFSIGNLKLTSWTPSDGEDPLWSWPSNAQLIEPLPSTGWSMGVLWCAPRANSSGMRQRLNAMNVKHVLLQRTISNALWQIEFWLLFDQFVALYEVWTWPQRPNQLMIFPLWGVGLPLTL